MRALLTILTALALTWSSTSNAYPCAPASAHVTAARAEAEGVQGCSLYAQQRWLDPTSGRFLSLDPVDGVVGEPLTTQGFTYANSNPTRFTDPDGRRPVGSIPKKLSPEDAKFINDHEEELIASMAQEYERKLRADDEAAVKKFQSETIHWSGRYDTRFPDAGYSPGLDDVKEFKAEAGSIRRRYRDEPTKRAEALAGLYEHVTGGIESEEKALVVALGYALDVGAAAGTLSRSRTSKSSGSESSKATDGKAARASQSQDDTPASPSAQAESARDAAGARLGRKHATYTAGEKDGRVVVGCSRNPLGCAEQDVKRQLGPDAKMTKAMGWRRNKETGELEWTEIPVCIKCQKDFLPSQFPPDVKADPGGSWGR